MNKSLGMDWQSIIEEHRRREQQMNQDEGKFDSGSHALNPGQAFASLGGGSTNLGGAGPSSSSSVAGQLALAESLGISPASLATILAQQTAPAPATTLMDYAALQQALLEEQARRDLVAQVLLAAQVAPPEAPTPSLGSILEKLGWTSSTVGLGTAVTSSASSTGGPNVTMLAAAAGIRDIAGAAAASQPPPKKQRTTQTVDKSLPVFPLSSTERKATFPLPSRKGKDANVPVRALPSFQKKWKKLGNVRVGDAALKQRFMNEFFARHLAKRTYNSLVRKVSLDAGEDAKMKKFKRMLCR